MDVRSAEFTKYAAYSMLATRISFMNELALLAENVGADIEPLRCGIGSEPRTGSSFLYPGSGYGGSCFPKDVKALIRTGRDHGVELGVLAAVDVANERQARVLVDNVVARFGECLHGCTFALWGLALKPDTDDMREAPSLLVVKELACRGAKLQAYDPLAMPQARRELAGVPGITFAPDQNAALVGADALLIVTEWSEFRSPDFRLILDTLKQQLIFDGRNLFELAAVRSFGIESRAIGRGDSVHTASQVNAAIA
ncbi:MAG TPA: UDP binding domain-containing protein [Burkholderiaceae bacterium]